MRLKAVKMTGKKISRPWEASFHPSCFACREFKNTTKLSFKSRFFKEVTGDLKRFRYTNGLMGNPVILCKDCSKRYGRLFSTVHDHSVSVVCD